MKIITTHKNADFDALGSVFAAALLYQGAVPVLPRTLNQNVRTFLSIHRDIFPYSTPKEVDLESVKHLIVVDAFRWSRLDGMEALKENKGLTIHVWDHHPEEGDIKASRVCHEQVGANCSLLVQHLRERKIRPSPIQATLFLAGIYEDTGNLTFPSTTAKDAQAVGILLEHGADLSILQNFLRPVYGPKQKDVLFKMLKHAERQKLNEHVVSINTVHISGHTSGLALVVDMYRDILNVDAAFGIFTEEGKDRCMVIGRSAGEGINIGSIMKGLGGGGHPNAGSALLKKVHVERIREWILELLQGNQQSSVQISDLMSFPVFSVPPSLPMKDVAMLLREKGCTGLPVVEKQRIVGIISRRDFRKLRRADHLTSPVKAFMNTKVETISPGKSVFQAVKIMAKKDIGRLPVVEGGRLIGIITRSDTMRYYYDLLPV